MKTYLFPVFLFIFACSKDDHEVEISAPPTPKASFSMSYSSNKNDVWDFFWTVKVTVPDTATPVAVMTRTTTGSTWREAVVYRDTALVFSSWMLHDTVWISPLSEVDPYNEVRIQWGTFEQTEVH